MAEAATQVAAEVGAAAPAPGGAHADAALQADGVEAKPPPAPKTKEARDAERAAKEAAKAEKSKADEERNAKNAALAAATAAALAQGRETVELNAAVPDVEGCVARCRAAVFYVRAARPFRRPRAPGAAARRGAERAPAHADPLRPPHARRCPACAPARLAARIRSPVGGPTRRSSKGGWTPQEVRTRAPCFFFSWRVFAHGSTLRIAIPPRGAARGNARAARSAVRFATIRVSRGFEFSPGRCGSRAPGGKRARRELGERARGGGGS